MHIIRNELVDIDMRTILRNYKWNSLHNINLPRFPTVLFFPRCFKYYINIDGYYGETEYSASMQEIGNYHMRSALTSLKSFYN